MTLTVGHHSIEISAQTVAQMQQAFMQRIHDAATAAVRKTGNTHLHADLVDYLIAAARKRQSPPASFLEALAGTDADAIQTHTRDLLAGRLFSAAQQKKLDHAAANRRQHAALDAVFKDGDRIYLEVQPTNEPSKTESAVIAHLKMHGYIVTDYKGGYATDTAGKNQYKIGRLLQSNDKLKFLYEGYRQDTTRVGNTMVVISRDPADIARMSAGQHWNSCMSPHRGEFDAFVHKDIEQGSLIAWLARKDDPHVFNAVSRVMIKPYADRPYNISALPPLDGVGHDVHTLSPISSVVNWLFGRKPVAHIPFTHSDPATIWVPERKVHGGNSPELLRTVDRFVAQHLNHDKPDGAYYLSPELYCDSFSSREYAKQGNTLRPVQQIVNNALPALDY